MLKPLISFTNIHAEEPGGSYMEEDDELGDAGDDVQTLSTGAS